MVARGIPDVVQVIVLAAGANALLSRGGTLQALVKTEEVVLELIHTRVGKKQRRVVLRDHRTRSHNGVAFALEKLQKSRANLGGRHVGVGFHKKCVLSDKQYAQFSGATKPRALHPQRFGEFYRKGFVRKQFPEHRSETVLPNLSLCRKKEAFCP